MAVPWDVSGRSVLSRLCSCRGAGCKKGVNEIIVLDLKGPKEATIVGLDKPILDMLRVAVPETHRKQGQTIKLEKETPVAAGTFKPGNGWQEVKVPATKGRYFCLEGLASFDNTNIAAIAEFDVLDEKGQKISRENWKIIYADSEETRSGNRTADKIYDLQESTFWQDGGQYSLSPSGGDRSRTRNIT